VQTWFPQDTDQGRRKGHFDYTDILVGTGKGRLLTVNEQRSYLVAEQVRAIYMQAPISNLTVFGISALYCLIFRDRLPSLPLGLWVLLMWTTSAYRLFLWYSHRRKANTVPDEIWLRRYTLGSVLVGVAWSMVVITLHDLSDLFAVVAIFMLIFGVLSSSVAILSVHLPAFIGYTYPQVLMLGGMLIHHQMTSAYLINLALIVYLLMLTLFARNANKQFNAHVMLATQNRELVGQLNTEIERREEVINERTVELSRTNQELGKEVAERKKAEDLAKLQYSLLSSVLDSTPDLIFYKDYRHRDGCYLGSNEAFAAFVGKPREEIIGKHDLELFEPETGNFFRTHDREVLNANATRINEESVTYPDGRVVLLSTLKTPFYDTDDNVLGILGVSRDITEQKQAEEALRQQERSLRHLAHHDPLTGLPNRLLLIDRLSQSIQKALRTNTGLAVLFIDLDHFKEINDSLGHSVGDQLLKAVSQRLQKSVRNEDTVARLGGDEFTILIEQLNDSMAASSLAEKILEAFWSPLRIVEQDLSITASIGISLYPTDGEDTETLLRNADAAMYRAKYEGRNAFRFYSSDMTERALARVAMESALRVALREGQFILHFQPQVDLQSGQLVGAEALVRWEHPNAGLLLPEHFIPVAEDTGQIVQIGAWVLEEVCRVSKRWEVAGMSGISVAVNLSGRQMLNSDLTRTVRTALEITGCTPASLELEITEGFLIQQPDKTKVTLQELRDMGIKIAIDDFGTGYSSLSYLKQFPISKLKIDSSFVHDIPLDANDQAISIAIIALGRSLGLKVVAEGVENQEQADFLKAQACDQAQGYLYGRPMTEEAFLTFWRSSAT
jgi:diguanylate cyclase (GGDEF)-like protein/PAS domain S-box-containing protein